MHATFQHASPESTHPLHIRNGVEVGRAQLLSLIRGLLDQGHGLALEVAAVLVADALHPRLQHQLVGQQRTQPDGICTRGFQSQDTTEGGYGALSFEMNIAGHTGRACVHG
mgnify:CR=1 FL=1